MISDFRFYRSPSDPDVYRGEGAKLYRGADFRFVSASASAFKILTSNFYLISQSTAFEKYSRHVVTPYFSEAVFRFASSPSCELVSIK